MKWIMEWDTKLFKIQNQQFAGVLQDMLFFKFAKFTEIHLCRSLFYSGLQVAFGKILWAISLIEQLRTTTSENKRLSFSQNL